MTIPIKSVTITRVPVLLETSDRRPLRGGTIRSISMVAASLALLAATESSAVRCDPCGGGGSFVGRTTAVAGSQPGSINLGSTRVGASSTIFNLTIGNFSTPYSTASYNDSLLSVLSVGGPFMVNHSSTITTANLVSGAGSNTPGSKQDIAVSMGTSAAGSYSRVIAISNTSIVNPSFIGNQSPVSLASQSVTATGAVYQAAIAGTQPTSIELGATRVGGTALSRNLTFANVAANTGGFTESLSASVGVSVPFTVNGGSSATTGNLGFGTSQTLALGIGSGHAGTYSGSVVIANTSIPVAGSGLSNLALASQAVSVTGRVYDLASALLSQSDGGFNFGTVRQGTNNASGSILVTNTATGNLADSLVTTVAIRPDNIQANTPMVLAAGKSALATFAINSATPGLVNESVTLGFASHDSELTDQALSSQTLNFSGLVTELAKPSFMLAGSVGTLTGSGLVYTLNLGNLTTNSGTVQTQLDVFNAIMNSSYSEALGGQFVLGKSNGFSFAGAAFAGLAGGAGDTGNFLDFNTTGISAGTYTDTLTFLGRSSFAGLTDQALMPIQFNITAQLNNAVGGVPEPTCWSLMLVGLGATGTALRRRKRGQIVAGSSQSKGILPKGDGMLA